MMKSNGADIEVDVLKLSSSGCFYMFMSSLLVFDIIVIQM